MKQILSLGLLILLPGLATAIPPAVTAAAYQAQGKSIVFAVDNQLWLFNSDRGELLLELHSSGAPVSCSKI